MMLYPTKYLRIAIKRKGNYVEWNDTMKMD